MATKMSEHPAATTGYMPDPHHQLTTLTSAAATMDMSAGSYVSPYEMGDGYHYAASEYDWSQQGTHVSVDPGLAHHHPAYYPYHDPMVTTDSLYSPFATATGSVSTAHHPVPELYSHHPAPPPLWTSTSSPHDAGLTSRYVPHMTRTSTSTSTSPTSTKPKRRRVQTQTQRKAANIR